MIVRSRSLRHPGSTASGEYHHSRQAARSHPSQLLGPPRPLLLSHRWRHLESSVASAGVEQGPTLGTRRHQRRKHRAPMRAQRVRLPPRSSCCGSRRPPPVGALFPRSPLKCCPKGMDGQGGACVCETNLCGGIRSMVVCVAYRLVTPRCCTLIDVERSGCLGSALVLASSSFKDFLATNSLNKQVCPLSVRGGSSQPAQIPSLWGCACTTNACTTTSSHSWGFCARGLNRPNALRFSTHAPVHRYGTARRDLAADAPALLFPCARPRG